jgi:hypothetical protein
MKDAQKPDHISLITLVNRLREGRFVIPDFQREFEWEPWDIQLLMRSIFLDYYIGSLLLWRAKPENLDALACEPIYGFEGRSEPTHIVLDGQQRLTAMYYAFIAPPKPAPGRKNQFLYFIDVNKFMAGLYDEAFPYDWKRFGQKLLENREQQFQRHLFPLAVIGQGGWELPNWVQGYENYWRERSRQCREAGETSLADEAARHAENARRFGEHLKEITEQYQVAYIELDRDLDLHKVCDIFTQINSRGVRLDIFDLMNALLKPKNLQLKHMWRDATERLSFPETERMNVYVLQVMSMVRQAHCRPADIYYMLPGQPRNIREADGTLRKVIPVPEVHDFEQLWHDAVEALEACITQLRHPQEFGAISPKYLPYVGILPAFASLHVAARNLDPSRQLDAKRKLRLWYWASVFTNRYSGQVETITERDYNDVTTWFQDDTAEPPVVDDFKARLRGMNLRRETTRNAAIYKAIFNLLVLKGARDWMTGNAPQYDDLDDHHIVPVSWAKAHRLQTSINTILNRTPLTEDTNRKVIGERLPNVYLPELIQQSGEETVRATLETHLISKHAFDILLRDPFQPDDFEEFISERQRTILEEIEMMLIQERIQLPARLRQIDAEIEHVEVSIRQLISQTLDDDATQLPLHVFQKTEERLEAALTKNPVMDEEHYATLLGRLEFADLRELQDTITNKQLWNRFEPFFRSKETLIKRLDQLANLRNAIRHSRTVDEVTRKEGEAALAWFHQVLMPRAPV